MRGEPLLDQDCIGLINFSRRFKGDFTRQVHLMVIAVVPEDVNVITHFTDSELGDASEVRLASGKRVKMAEKKKAKTDETK